MTKISDLNYKRKDKCALTISDEEVIGTINPTPESCMKKTILYDKKYLFPFFSIEGSAINDKYKGLKFHAFSCPEYIEYIDYRLTEDNKYELLAVDDLKVSDFKEYSEFLEELLEYYDGEEEAEHFEMEDESPQNVSMSIEEYRSTGSEKFFELGINGTGWRQSTYIKSDEDIDYDICNVMNYNQDEDQDKISEIRDYLWEYHDVTDYQYSRFFDENGDNLEFLFKTSDGFNLFGEYHVYFSPKTRLVRIFFQCS